MLLYSSLGDWYDNDGKKLSFLNWDPQQPNHAQGLHQDFASIKSWDGTWGDYQDDPRTKSWNMGQVVCLQQLKPKTSEIDSGKLILIF